MILRDNAPPSARLSENALVLGTLTRRPRQLSAGAIRRAQTFFAPMQFSLYRCAVGDLNGRNLTAGLGQLA
jgi:hypothetical protein